MAINVDFYTFAKKVNSTKVPSGTAALSTQCIIKRGSSIISPTIELDIGLATSPASYNYCYISDWGRYYFVSDWIFNERLWTAKLTVDPLASFKSSIGSYTGYILRSASAANGNVVDMLYPALASVSTSANNSDQGESWDNSMDSGCYVIGIMGKSSGQNGGAVTYYKATSSQMQALCNYMLDTSHLGTITDIEDDLLKCIFNPLQYIVSCMWFPVSPTTVGGDPYVGWWLVSGSGMHPISDSLRYSRSLTYDIPKHPKASSRGNYLNMAPFSKYYLYAGPFGCIPIDSSYLIGKSKLYTYVRVDFATGSGKLTIEDSSGNVIEEHFAQVGVPVAVGQNSINQGAVTGLAGGVMNTIGNALTGNPVGMLESGLQTIGNAAELSQSIPSTRGSNGTCAFSNQFRLVGRFFDVADADNTSRGRPLCSARQISSLSGYILCSDADPSVACTDSELAQIVSYMNGGFYYE